MVGQLDAAASGGRGDVWQGFWRLADPKISITSLACMLVGGSVAAQHAPLHWGWLAVTGVALFCMEVAKNAWGDVFDFDSGTDLAVLPEDRTAFSGGKRVLVDALLTRRQTWALAIGFAAVGCGLGAAIVFGRAPEALWLGLVGLVFGWSYHGPPLRLAYRGFGELDVVLCYGPLIAMATYVVQRREWSWEVLWLALPLGLCTAAFLLANEFPDYRADVGAAKRNLVVRLGREAAARLVAATYALAFATVVVLPFAGFSPWYLLGLLPAPLALWVTATIRRAPTTFYRDHPAQPVALLVFVLYALSAALASGLLVATR
ncbi:MAG: prenyltransferase [Planctomycetes bacterium]|nr:prenyltransferase [Planctomycetota bacterium]MCB9885608.1 prenyltransferase [Planctomycetota bacterium]